MRLIEFVEPHLRRDGYRFVSAIHRVVHLDSLLHKQVPETGASIGGLHHHAANATVVEITAAAKHTAVARENTGGGIISEHMAAPQVAVIDILVGLLLLHNKHFGAQAEHIIDRLSRQLVEIGDYPLNIHFPMFLKPQGIQLPREFGVGNNKGYFLVCENHPVGVAPAYLIKKLLHMVMASEVTEHYHAPVLQYVDCVAEH